jgi:hypothetical protein
MTAVHAGDENCGGLRLLEHLLNSVHNIGNCRVLPHGVGVRDSHSNQRQR